MSQEPLDFWSKVAIIAGAIAFLAFMFWLGTITDAIIGLIEVSI